MDAALGECTTTNSRRKDEKKTFKDEDTWELTQEAITRGAAKRQTMRQVLRERRIETIWLSIRKQKKEGGTTQ